MTSRIAWLYTALVVSAAAALVSLDAPRDPGTRFWADLIVLQLLFLVCDSTPAWWRRGSPPGHPAPRPAWPRWCSSGRSARPWSARCRCSACTAPCRWPAGSSTAPCTPCRATWPAVTFVALQRSYPAAAPFGLPHPAYFPALLLPFAAAAVVHALANHGLDAQQE